VGTVRLAGVFRMDDSVVFTMLYFLWGVFIMGIFYALHNKKIDELIDRIRELEIALRMR